MEITFDFGKINKDVKKVLATPSKFFSKNANQDWKETLSYFLILSAIGLVLTLLYLAYVYPIILEYFPAAAPEGEIDNSLLSLAPYALYSYLLGIFFSFFWGGALLAWTRMFKLDGDFNKAYKVITYARTLVYLLSWVPVVNIAVWLHSLYLIYKGIKNAYKASNKVAAGIVFTGVLAVFVLSSVFIYLIQTT